MGGASVSLSVRERCAEAAIAEQSNDSLASTFQPPLTQQAARLLRAQSRPLLFHTCERAGLFKPILSSRNVASLPAAHECLVCMRMRYCALRAIIYARSFACNWGPSAKGIAV
eukprot:scaffold5353_cov134-Isochrysis_galbana.AAC.5